MTDATDLLQRHRPVVRYDSQEVYFADSAAIWTNASGNVLRRDTGEIIAVASPAGDQQQLGLDFLAEHSYPGGPPVLAGDVISDPARDYASQAATLHQQIRYRNRMYVQAGTGSDGRLWLQYWFFYFYNDYNLLGPLVHAGLHEGDWEMIQLRLDETQAVPDFAVYAQHAHAQAKDWADLESVDHRPVIYPARGSHASYFTRGTHWTGVWFDHADGRRHTPDLALEIIADGDDGYDWIYWPGHWGDTTPRGGLDSTSPTGPAGHAQWGDPVLLLEKAHEHARLVRPPAPVAPPAPTITATRQPDGELQLTYHMTVPSSDDPPAQLIATVNSPQDPRPPMTYRTDIRSADGNVVVPVHLQAGRSYDIHVSAATRGGIASPATETDLAQA